MADDIGGVWRTVGGRRIFIKDGQDLASAMKESGKFEKTKSQIYYKDKKTGKYIGRNINGEYFGLTDDKEKAILNKKDIEKLKNSSKFFKKSGIEPEIEKGARKQTEQIKYSEKKDIENDILAKKEGYKNYEEYSKAKQDRLNKILEANKKEYEESYVFKNKNSKYDAYNINFDSEQRISDDNKLYNNEVFSELIKRRAKQYLDIEETHSSAKKGSKFGDSIYLKDKKTGNEVRISNHELPETAEREYNQQKFGHRWNNEVVLNQETMESIAKIKTEQEFKKYIKDLFK